MPRPSLGIAVRCLSAIGWLCAAGIAPIAAQAAEDALQDDQVVPAQFQMLKRGETSQSKHAEESDDDFPYQGLTIVQSGTSSSATRKQAVAELPLDALPSDVRQKTQSVIKGMSLYRRLPTISFEVDRNVYGYFLKHPQVAVSSWRAMGISKFTLEETRPQVYSADAGDGSQGTVAVSYTHLTLPTKRIV